jgi:hypothetical protein
MLRRVRGRSTCYYYQHPDGKQMPLSSELDASLKKWAEIHTTPAAKAPDTFVSVAAEFEKHGTTWLAVKTQKEYSAALKRLSAVFKDAPLSEIRPMD